MTLRTSIFAQIHASQSVARDIGTAVYDLKDVTEHATLLDGTAASKADVIFTDTRTLAASANEDLDLAGSLSAPLGGSAVFAKVKAILIKAAAGNSNNVVVKPAASNGFTGPFGAATHTISIPPGGAFLICAPVNGWAVTASTGDLINVANGAAGTPVTYTITVVGTSA